MRIYHRYLGFFLAGIMAIYSVSGIIMIFRDTDFLKKENQKVITVATGLESHAVGAAIKIKNLKIKSDTLDVVTFENGTYNKTTGVADFKVMELPYLLNKMTKMHKATHKDPLYYLNIFFGVSLFFFVISSFYMFMPGTTIFKKGMYFTLAGIVLVLVMLFF
jgi:multisubunit Na+/H+ antiporter MnhG subunit